MSGDSLAKITRSPFSKSKYFLSTSILESKTKKTLKILKIEIQILKTSLSILSDHSGSALTIKMSDTRTCSYNLEPDPDDPI